MLRGWQNALWHAALLFCCLVDALPQHHAIEDLDPGLVVRQEPNLTVPGPSPGRIVRTQLINPVGILSVLLIIGGDIVQKACAQLASGLRLPYGTKHTSSERHYFSFTPVAFSFGWVAYAFTALSAAFGEGILMPKTDVGGLVLTPGGQWKNNESWIIGRLLRDLELAKHREEKGGMRIDFYRSCRGVAEPNRDRVWWLFLLAFSAQFALAAVPVIIHPERPNWTILLITGAGTGLALLAGCMPQWGEEKYPGRRVKKDTTYVLTGGNGHSHVFVILVNKDHNFKNLDDLATTRPIDNIITRLMCVFLAVLWLFLLTIVGGLEEDGWFLLGLGLIGMGHNVVVANWPREPVSHGLPIEPHPKLTVVEKDRVFEALYEFEFHRDLGRDHEPQHIGAALRPIFLPAGLYPSQQKRWNAKAEKRRARMKAKADQDKRDGDTVSTSGRSGLMNPRAERGEREQRRSRKHRRGESSQPSDNDSSSNEGGPGGIGRSQPHKPRWSAQGRNRRRATQPNEREPAIVESDARVSGQNSPGNRSESTPRETAQPAAADGLMREGAPQIRETERTSQQRPKEVHSDSDASSTYQSAVLDGGIIRASANGCFKLDGPASAPIPQAFEQLFPRGARVLWTNGQGLQCGLYAVIKSLQSMRDDQGMDVPVPTFKHLQKVATNKYIRKYFDEWQVEGEELNTDKWFVDQVAAIALYWGLSAHGVELHMGVIVEGRPPMPILLPDDRDGMVAESSEPVVFFIHNDEGSHSEKGRLNHYSGLGPR